MISTGSDRDPGKYDSNADQEFRLEIMQLSKSKAIEVLVNGPIWDD